MAVTACGSKAIWFDVPDDAVITEPNRVGRTMVCANSRLSRADDPLFHAGQHDVN